MTDETKKPRTKRTLAERTAAMKADLKESADKALARAFEREQKAKDALHEAVAARTKLQKEIAALSADRADMLASVSSVVIPKAQPVA